MFQHYPLNEKGEDYAVGDVHGCFDALLKALEHIGFDPLTDRLFVAGDLVGKGPQSVRVEHWLRQPWLHAVRGNHDDAAVRFAKGNPIDQERYRRNGDGWILDLPPEAQKHCAEPLDALPYAIEVETRSGLVGIVHADCPFDEWPALVQALTAPATRKAYKETANACMRSRERLDGRDERGVAGLEALVVGHCLVEQVLWLGNVIYIDTGGWTQAGQFTLLNLNTLQVTMEPQLFGWNK